MYTGWFNNHGGGNHVNHTTIVGQFTPSQCWLHLEEMVCQLFQVKYKKKFHYDLVMLSFPIRAVMTSDWLQVTDRGNRY